MNPVEAAKPAAKIWPLVLGEAIAIALAVAAMLTMNLGWLGAILILAIVTVFTLMIVRAGEQRASDLGSLSPAMRRYNRRMLIASAVYVVGLFGAILAHDMLQPPRMLAFLFALAPSVGVLMMILAMGRLIAEETDEYLRLRYVKASLVGLGTLLTLATVWGFFEQFDLVPHAPSWLAVPVFALGMGLFMCGRWGRE